MNTEMLIGYALGVSSVVLVWIAVLTAAWDAQ